jgi:hypothetical protein
MKRKLIIAAFAIVILCCLAVFLLRHAYLLVPYKQVTPLSIHQIQEMVQKAGGGKVLQKEAAEAILLHVNDAHSLGITNCPAITRMASLVGGEIIRVDPDDTDGVGVPAHVLIRRGSHFDYQFIYIFGTGSVPATNNLKIELIRDGIYLRNTAS